MTFARLRELLNDVTPGPWSWMATGEKDNSWALGLAVDPRDESPIRGCVNDWESEHYDDETGDGPIAIVVEHVCSNEGSNAHLADPEFIAAVRNVFPLLLDVAEAAANPELVLLERHPDYGPQWAPVNATMRAAAEQLRSSLNSLSAALGDEEADG